MREKTFDVRNMTRTVDELLAATTSPRQRAILENFRRHAMLEVAGRWREILVPEMMVDHPVYRINEQGETLVLEGMQAVADFYQGLEEAGLTVFGAIEEYMAVADWGLAIHSFFGHHIPGYVLQAQGEDIDDPDAYYQLTHWQASFWPYDEHCKLIGEHIYEDLGSRKITKMDPAEVITPEQARAILAPMLEKPWSPNQSA